MNDEKVQSRVLSAWGTHLIVEGMMSEGKGILVSATSDGWLVFILPYKGYTMIGTTDIKDEPTHNPEPTKEEIEFLKEEARKIFGKDYSFEGKIK